MENVTRYGATRPNCPLCGAYPGESCTTASGRTTNRHVTRIAAETAYSEAEEAHYALELARVERERIAAHEGKSVEATITKTVLDGSTANGAVIWDSVEVEVSGGNSHQQTMAALDTLDAAQDSQNAVACVSQYSTELDTNTGVVTFRFI